LGRRSVLALPILLHDAIAGARLQLLQRFPVADLLCLGYGGLVLLLLERQLPVLLGLRYFSGIFGCWQSGRRWTRP